MNLKMEYSLLTSLEGNALQDLPFLESISITHNSIHRIDAIIFKDTFNVKRFNMSYNKLTYLPHNIFDSWSYLNIVDLSHNELLTVARLFRHNLPVFLDYRILTDLGSRVPHELWNLETLILSHNPIDEVPSNFFNTQTNRLRYLYMDHCLIQKFDPNIEKHLSGLEVLDLRYNKIKNAPDHPIDFSKNLELLLGGNLIREFKVMHSVFKIDLSQNFLQTLDEIFEIKFGLASEIALNKNELQYLTEKDFANIEGCKVLKLQENQIKWIDRLTFKNLTLNHLNLSHNFLTTLNGSVQSQSRLKYLYLASNQISVFESGEFSGLDELSELYISDNLIATLGGHFRELPRLLVLALSNNSIETVEKDQMPRSLQYLYLRDNSFRCDCKLHSFLQWLTSSDSPNLDNPLCVSSSHASNHVPSCPSECNCYCTHDDEEYFMAIDCSSKNISILPQFLTGRAVQNTSTKINLLPNYYFENQIAAELIHIFDTIGEINLSNNELDSLENARLPVDLRHLFLHLNKIKVMPNALITHLSQLRQVSFFGNPWSCECEALDFREWLFSNMKIVKNMSETRCSKTAISGEDTLIRKTIVSTAEEEMCPTYLKLYFSFGFGSIAFLLIITVLKIVHARYRINIYVWLYAHGVTRVKEKDIDRDKLYDAFLSFSHEDQDLVIREIISVIEVKQPMTRLCLHYKDFEAGEFIDANIFKAVQNSKKTVILLSKNFLESEWCIYEFRAAHMQAQKDKVNRVIIIKLGELPEDIHPDIKVYLKSTTYLTWGEKYFWEKLFYVLPISRPKDDGEDYENYASSSV